MVDILALPVVLLFMLVFLTGMGTPCLDSVQTAARAIERTD
jgi:hypothetical protein